MLGYFCNMLINISSQYLNKAWHRVKKIHSSNEFLNAVKEYSVK